MRGLMLALVGLSFLPVIVHAPFAGVLVYSWYQYMAPDRISWGLVKLIPFSMIFAVTTIVGWLLFDRKRLPKVQFVFVVFLLFFVWINVTTLFALVPLEAAVKWDRSIKVMGFALLAMVVLTRRVRIEAFVWVFVLSVGYYAFAGAINTFFTGGGGDRVRGAVTSFLGERNSFAVAMLIAIPLIVFLYRHTTILPATRAVRAALVTLVGVMTVAVIGTQSRGALVAALPLMGSFFLRSRRKMLVLFAGVTVTGIAVLAAPPEWYARMETIGRYEEDKSASSRIDSWLWAVDMAQRHPLTGGGFRAFTLNIVNEKRQKWLEAHSIYFEVLAEHGVVGFALFIALLVGIWRSLGRSMVEAGDRPDLLWVRDLAAMLQLSLLAFATGGLFLSIAFHPMLYDFAALAVVLRGHVLARAAETTPGPAALSRPAEEPA